ncbi:hypothetical protein [Kitasatospora sp. NPDC059327]|uniref:hypothetical protein n=1 Tax=Kitasatospora sp. NPDC059327 TaxID=3346803 RepID=UPI0036C18E60
MTTADLIWALVLGVGAVVEAYALCSRKLGDTLSERTRAWLHVRTKPGRALFTVGWCGFSVWFLLHILTESM